jgi:phosphonate transport system permease protein
VLALFVLFPGVLPGAVALGVYTLGVLGRLMAEVVEAVDPAPLRALAALGASPAQAFGYGVLPQAMPGMLSYSLYRWEVCTRETVIVGVVGAAGLGRVLSEQLSSFDHDGVTTTLLAFVALTLAVDLAGAWARRRVRGG